MALLLQKTCIALCIFALARLAVPSSAAPVAAGAATAGSDGNGQDDELANSLGQWLGLPVGTDIGSSSEQQIPEFLLDIYNCWREGHPEQCSVSPSANLVRSFVATVDRAPPVAVESMSNDRLTNTFTLNFNMSLSNVRPNEELMSSKLRVYKKSLDALAMDTLESKCSDLSEFEIQLYVRIGQMEQEDIMWLKSSAVISASDLLQDQWIEFDNLNEIYETAIKRSHELKKYLLSLRLMLHPAHLCTSTVSPSDLGFTSTPEKEGIIYGIARRDEIDLRMMQSAFAALSQRTKRQTDIEEISTEAPTTSAPIVPNVTAPVDVPTITTPNPNSEINSQQYQTQSCRLNYHNVSFADLGWGQYILRPSYYIANFCAGTCRFPFNSHDNTTKHSYIQGLASHWQPELIPPPCCAPEAGTLQPLSVVYQAGPDVFQTENWGGMIATTCGCL